MKLYTEIIEYITKKTSLSSQQAWWIIEHITKKNRTTLQWSNESLSKEQAIELESYIHDLKYNDKPLAYILGWIPFLNLTLKVNPPTLIPRPETEYWVDKLITSLQKTLLNKPLTILDIGCGSGCISLALAQALPYATIYAVDIAQSAVNLTQQNAQLNNISNVICIQSDLFNQLPNEIKFDFIVSNPPYIDRANTLEKSVHNWEDHGALFADNKGCFIIEQIIQQAEQYLKKNPAYPQQLILEIDCTQGEIVESLLKKYGFSNIKIDKDQYDRNRTIQASSAQ